MSNLSRFLKKNKKEKVNIEYAVTKSLVDDNGEPLKWVFRSLTTSEGEAIRDSCTMEVPIRGKSNQFRYKLNTSKYIAKMISTCVVFPDLNDVELQNSYGVMSGEELIKEMVDNPGEYTELSQFVQGFNGFDEVASEDIEEAKN